MLRRLAEDLWVADHPLKIGPLAIGTRMTVVRLSSGALFLHSPVPLGDELRSALEKCGRVGCIVAPNRMHHFYVAEAAAAFPDAGVWLAPGLAEKVKTLPEHRVLGDEPDPAWFADLDQVHVRGADTLSEVAFLHRASRTLLLTDLAFNFRHVDGVLTRLFWKLNGAIDHFGPTRTVKFLIKDKPAVRAGIDRILEWDFDRVTVTHGDVLETGGHEALRASYAAL